MYHPEDKWTARQATRRVSPRPSLGEETGATPYRADLFASDRQKLATQRDTIDHMRGQLRARISDLVAELDDATQAVAEAHAEQDLGVTCFALGALEARRDKCAAAVTALQVELAALDVLHDALTSLMEKPARIPASAA